MRSFKVILVGMVLAAALILLPGGSAAQESSSPPAQTTAEPVEVVSTNGDLKVKLNFQDTPLQTVLEYLSETAGLTVISDEPIADSRMTVISRQPISLNEAVALINSILKEKSLTTVLGDNKTLKVVTLANAKKENIPVLSGRDPSKISAGDNVVTYVIPVGHVSASSLKQNLESLRPDYASIEANDDSNTLIITDTTANIKRLMQIVVALDQHMSSVAEIRVFPLRNANATSTATLINNIFQQQAQGGTSRNRQTQGRGGPFEMMMQMRGGPGADRGRAGANAQGQTGQAGGSMNVQVIAAADEQTNRVVVRGPAEALNLVAGIIDELDDKTAKVADVRVFQLRYADATNTADVINQLFNQSQSSSSTRGRTGRGAMGGMEGGPMMFRGPFGGPGGEQQAEGTGLVQVTAAADSRTNTVVVTGPESVLNVVAGVVEKLDSPISNVADVKVFHLEYADATDTAELINEVFGQSSTSSSRSSRSSQQTQQVRFGMGGRGGMGGFGGMMGGQTAAQGGGSMSDVSVTASADSRTNSIVVSGPPETLAIIAQVIKELDENPEQERRIFVYALKNANATNLMTILNNLFTEMAALEQQGTSSRGGQQFQGAARGGATGGAAGGGTSSSDSGDLSDETYFEADPNTNSLLCMTSTKNYEKIRPIIEELDKAVGQVLIKVLFAEVTHSNNVDWGTEFSMLNLSGDGDATQSIGVFGRPTELTTPGSVASATNPNTLGPGASGPMGLSVRTLQGDIDLTIHALQQTGRLNVLSRPYVLTRNNQMATITVVEEVPVIGDINQGTSTTQTSFEYRDDIGIVLQVTPSVNPDGLVNMTVTPSITTRTGETIQIAEGVNPEVFATRSASTRVAVLDGQTIVIGGLIEDQMSETVRKVPILGDIPIAGQLFRRTIKDKSKTELLIFLTPHVAKEPIDLTAISQAEHSRSSLNTDEQASELFKNHMDAMKGLPKTPAAEPNTPAAKPKK